MTTTTSVPFGQDNEDRHNVVQLHNVNPATRFDLIIDDLDMVAVGFDFAEYQSGTLSLWVTNEDEGAFEVAVLYQEDDESDPVTVRLLAHGPLDHDIFFTTNRVSLMAPFGAPRLSVDALDRMARKSRP